LSTNNIQYNNIKKNNDGNHDKIIFRQLFDARSSTYTYLLGCKDTSEAILIDPVYECVERDLNLIKELNLQLKYVADTHIHADHITGAGLIKTILNESNIQSIIYNKQAKADIHVQDNDIITLGKNINLKVVYTPGHTNCSCSFYFQNPYTLDDMLFTGDTLFIRGCGRTDFQNGNSKLLFQSVRSKLFAFNDACSIYPAHDYNGMTISTIGEEKKYNPRLNLNITEEKFLEIMKNLHLANPKKMDISLPANFKCGYIDDVFNLQNRLFKRKEMFK